MKPAHLLNDLGSRWPRLVSRLGGYSSCHCHSFGMNANVNVSDRARSIPPCAGRGKQEELKNMLSPIQAPRRRQRICYHLYKLLDVGSSPVYIWVAARMAADNWACGEARPVWSFGGGGLALFDSA